MVGTSKPWKESRWHNWGLLGILVLGGLLRFWQLDQKPLWLDEVLTALFSLGRGANDVPQNQVVPLTDLAQIFSWQAGQSCGAIAQRVATDSNHPPLFFCLLYQWLGWLQPTGENLIWALRSLSALFGMGAIAASYLLGRVVVSPLLGLVAAAIMAVSPFAVYLSQEARHYTLPMIAISLALTGLVQMQRDLTQQSFRPWIWLGWIVANLIGLYTHYFVLLAIVAQVCALLIWMVTRTWRPGKDVSLSSPRLWDWGAVGLAIAGLILGYAPWLPTMIGHLTRPETSWLTPYDPDWVDRIESLGQLVIGWVVMAIALPVEQQPLIVTIPSALMMLMFTGWLGYQITRGFRQCWQTVPDPEAIALLLSFTVLVLLEFLFIIYGLDKDITEVPRYNFVYYPSVCILLSVSLSGLLPRTSWRSLLILLIAGVISSSFVATGWVFQKPYRPEVVAADLRQVPDQPTVLLVSYQSLQEIALGLSWAMALENTQPSETYLVFAHRPRGYGRFWRTLDDFENPVSAPLNLWVVASPGMKTEDYATEIRLQNPTGTEPITCAIAPDSFDRIGFPYQLFQCQSS